ncbi:putative neutral sphingomyelinase isoform X3 [Apostichopus japonicus]|uniref:sphingomyelin phosphodiesterase n=1 Tax=Stichopus japonicus TaxID=307972 RepID=A0A2G8K949_STIJA|nr:putative neutral sphingomyelinase isoform X3 [Apostichopus japonicus]
MIGSGCCVFSRWPIVDVGYSKFTLNGFPHRLDHCDWYGGKLVGMCVIQKDEYRIQIYTTHMHAMYAPSHQPAKDQYSSHRITQSYELSEYARQTSGDADLVLVMGDLNSEPHSLSFKVIHKNSDVLDSWETRLNKDEKFDILSEAMGNTIETRENSHTDLGHLHYPIFPNGIRIDFILYKAGRNRTVNCTEARVALSRKIPGTDMNYSDHNGYEAFFELREQTEKERLEELSKDEDLESKINVLNDLYQKIQTARIQGHASKKFNIAAFLVGFFLLLMIFVSAFWDTSTLRGVMASILVCMGWFYSAYRLIFVFGTVNTLRNVEDSIYLRREHFLRRAEELKVKSRFPTYDLKTEPVIAEDV